MVGLEKIDFNELKKKAWENRKMILILLVIFLLAFTVRAHLMRYEFIFGFDSYYHARIAGDLAEFGFLPETDPLAYYQEGGSTMPPTSFFWVATAAIYNIFTFGSGFSNETWIIFVKVLPALFGALISLSMYWLGKEIFGSKKNPQIGKIAGLAMAFIAATVPSFVYRTMAGFFEEDSLGFLWMVIGLVFFVRAVKSRKITKESLINSAIAGVFFTLMAFTWALYLLIPLVLLFYFIFAILFVSVGGKKEEVTAFIANSAVSFVIMTIITFAAGHNWFESAVKYINQFLPKAVDPLTMPVIIVALLASIGLSYLFARMKGENRQVVMAILLIALYLMPLVMTMFFVTVPDIANRTSIHSMVGEENTGKQFFGTKYNSLIMFPIIAIVLIPVSMMLFRKRKFSHPMLIIFFWVIITLVMAFYKLKFTYTLGLPIAAATGFTAYFVFRLIDKAKFGKGIETKVLVTALFFVILLGVGSAGVFVPDKVPYLESNRDWQESNEWIIENTPEGAKLFNWWDQGHIMSFVTERKVSTDNRNWSNEANKALADFVTTPDTNLAYGIASEQIGADYIVLDSSMFIKEATFKFYDLGKIDYANAEVRPYYEGVVRVMNCKDQGDKVVCQGNSFPKEEYEGLPSEWTSSPSQFYNGKVPVYIYRSTGSLIAINQAVNNSNLAKVWFSSSETKGLYEEVFANGTIRIYRIIR